MDGEIIVLYRVKDPNSTEKDGKKWSTTNVNGEGIPVEFVLPFGYEMRSTKIDSFIVNYITGDVARISDAYDGRPMLYFPGIKCFPIDFA